MSVKFTLAETKMCKNGLKQIPLTKTRTETKTSVKTKMKR